jgi:tellurium resistance protein TerD
VHSGDVKKGEKEGFDETITIEMSKLSGVTAMVFVLSCYSNGDLKDCESAMVEVRNMTAGKTLNNSTLPPKSSKSGFLVGILFKHPDNNNWHWSSVGEPIKNGRTFMAALPQIRKLVDQVLDPGVIGERKMSADKTFNMVKGDSLTIGPEIPVISLGLGWETRGEGIDLDASCILLKDVDGDGKLDPVNVVYFGNKLVRGVQTMGDNRTGAGAGDDETINVCLRDVDPTISALAFVVNVYTNTATFESVTSAYVRLYNKGSKHEYCRYKLDVSHESKEVKRKHALVFCMITREGTSNNWEVTMIGEHADGNTARGMTTTLWDGIASTAFAENYTFPYAGGDGAASGGGGGCCVIA